MELANIGPRKLSRGKSMQQGARSFLSRKSAKRSETLNQPQHPPPSNNNTLINNSPSLKLKNQASFDDYSPLNHQRPLLTMRSIIPDPLSELPTWYKTHEVAFNNAAQYRARYPMHNPVGPRRYRNHHLAPPSTEKRPPSFFSPSFPPMAATASQENKLPGPSRTPSGSPLPTPTSSQTRIHDIRGRTRKISQTAHDGVDLLDGTDPWGTNWHHQSPYDVGHNHDRVSPENSEPPTATSSVSRPRRMSMTTSASAGASASRHRTVTPSPLSQSTSAVHLAVDPPAPHLLPRRLSKNRKPFRGLFGGSFDSSHTSSKTDAEHSTLKRGASVGPSIPSSASVTSDKKHKRGSFMGRLVKRFSVMRKPDSSRASMTGSHDNSNHTVSLRASVDMHAAIPSSTPSPVKPDLHHVKSNETARPNRPVSTQVDAPPPTAASPNGINHDDADSHSVSSIEANYSIGKLTIANPDDPSSSSVASPVGSPLPLPSVPDRFIEVATFRPKEERAKLVLESPLSQSPQPLESPMVMDSPLPLPSRLSTILSADHSESPYPPPPELPPEHETPASIPSTIPESPLPPSPQPTRPPTPVEKTSTTYAPSPPTSPLAPPSMNINAHDVLPNGMSPSLPTSTTQISLPSLPSMSDSPLSRASMIANPPTPHPPSKAILTPPPVSTLPVPQMQPHHSQDSQRSQESAHTTASSSRRREKEGSGSQQQLQVPHPHQRVKSSPGTGKIRQTETFRLARSPSGNVLPNSVGQGFVAEGEMWEVVGTASEEKKSRREKSTKSKEKEKEQEREREKEKEREREKERVKEREREREREKEKEQQRASGSSGATPSREKSKKHDRGSTEDVDSDQKGRHRRSVNGRHDHSSSSSTPTARTPTSEIPPTRPGNPERRRSSTKDIRDSRPDTIRATQTRRSFVDKPQPPTPTTITITPSSGSRREKRTSGSGPTRPSSEFQTGHDINALKAKEAWDLERLWKGRSMMYGPDGTALVSTRPTIGSDSRPSTIMSADIHRATSIPSVADLHRATTMPANHAHGHGATHGSSHTYFVVQAPPPGVPHGAPYPGYQAPPPIIYAPTPDPAGPLPFARRDYPKTQRSFPDHIPFPSAPDLSPPRKSLANPLPEPPRLSSYRPGPLPESLAGSTEGTASPEFWTKYAGVTTSH